MRKAYIKLNVTIENLADFVTTSTEVETDRITALFPQYTENTRINSNTAENAEALGLFQQQK